MDAGLKKSVAVRTTEDFSSMINVLNKYMGGHSVDPYDPDLPEFLREAVTWMEAKRLLNYGIKMSGGAMTFVLSAEPLA